ncbi:MAG: type II toxin-antitoxin system HicA family toxin [Treponema sp.]|nr:type II toxin-antitoxin system HicA family toxin [Treponema sp.]
MTGVEMIKMLKKNGFTVIKISKESHYHMIKDTKYTIVPHHHKELGKGLYHQILNDAGLK